MKFISDINRIRFTQVFLLVLTIIIVSCSNNNLESNHLYYRDNFPDVLDVLNTPMESVDWNSFFFSDQGAWFGFALPDTNKTKYKASFAGPFLMTNGKWLGKSIVNLEFYDKNSERISIKSIKSIYYPGKLVQELSYKDFKATMSLIFISSDAALIHVEFKDIKNQIEIVPEWSGSVFTGEGKVNSDTNQILIHGANLNSEIQLSFINYQYIENCHFTDTTYSCKLSSFELSENNNLSVIVSYSDENSFKNTDYNIKVEALKSPTKYLNSNQERWDSYLSKALQTNASWGNKKEYQHIAVKSLQTLINNWRCPYGDLLHDGLFPSASVNYFNGFWAWDSWKHAVALVTFEPKLAKNQVRTMYDYQHSAGMIADCIYQDSTYNNWLNTKPPLSGWAIWKIFETTNDTSFVKEMFSKLVKYHEWWYQYRDFNHNKLCEYGSSDGSLIAAKWESGMDNAIRFDNSTIVKIDESNYAFSQESVDLNSYLYFEKLFITKMSNLLGYSSTADKYKQEARYLKDLIESKMFDQATGYFYDINLETGEIIPVQGPEGWTPLFTGLASAEYAKDVAKIMLDTSKFNTYIPFPTAPKDDPGFSKGYWRGPIWLDQVYFAITALDNYGYEKEINEYTLQTFDRLQGLKEQAPIRENYWPLTGEGMRVNHFSWSAAHLLLLYNK